MKTIIIAFFLGLATSIKLDKPEKATPYEASESTKGGAEWGLYERVITPRFSSDGDDIFMRSMIKKYAQEERTDIDKDKNGDQIGGEPTGKFWMTQQTAYDAAKEVIGTHKGLKEDELESYLATYFGKTWAHFDVNQTG